MKNRNHFKIAAVIMGFLSIQTVHAFELTALGGINIASPSVSIPSATTAVVSSTGIAFGAFLDHPLIAHLLKAELGAVYQQDRYSVTGFTPVGSTDQMNSIRIPLLARFIGLPFISFGFGPYYMFAIGDYSVGATSMTYSATSLSTSEFGLDGDVRLEFPLAPTLGIVLDAQYLMGLSQRGTTPAVFSYKTRDIQILGGVSFGF